MREFWVREILQMPGGQIRVRAGNLVVNSNIAITLKSSVSMTNLLLVGI